MEWEVGEDLAAGQSQGVWGRRQYLVVDTGVSMRGPLVPRPPEQLSGGGECTHEGAASTIKSMSPSCSLVPETWLFSLSLMSP